MFNDVLPSTVPANYVHIVQALGLDGIAGPPSRIEVLGGQVIFSDSFENAQQ